MAKFGIALGSGPRGLGFESRYSDQRRKSGIRSGCRTFFVTSVNNIKLLVMKKRKEVFRYLPYDDFKRKELL